LIRLLTAALAGILLVLAYEPFGFWILAPIGLAIFIYTLHQVQITSKFFIGFIFGLSFWLIQINWLSVLSPAVLTITAIALSFFYGIFAMFTEIFQKSKMWSIYSAISFLTLESLFNYWPFGGFNWGTIGFITSENPFASGVEIIGVFGLSVLIYSLSLTLIACISLIRNGAANAAFVTLVIWILIPGAIDALKGMQQEDFVSNELMVGVVQGNVPRLGLEFNAQRKAVYQNHISETYRLLDQNKVPLDLIIWPENAPDVDPFTNDEVIRELNLLAKDAAAPILVGSRMQSELGPVNAGILIEGDTDLNSAFLYAKQKLVPFGEKIPLESFLAPIAQNFGPISESLVPGTSAGILEIDGKKLGLLICFEVAWGQLAKDVVEQGAMVLIIQTNNATYGLTSQLSQQFNIAKLRAIESQKQVVTVATSGISGQIDRDGSVIWVADEFVAASAALQLDLYSGVSFGLQSNYYLQIIIVFSFLALSFFGIIRGRIKNYVE
jgi:apolipoprotein N-acyltransferase